ncbi:proton/peptide symporter family protein [Legionella geestiana]|uniref:Proton/peptide symporter family protein n=1 Tax=Legionella geestiana TaxID=45065 RepID=A0A0W0U222_9GAMM|nr:oligopeptide:H+ symporter [Legionella geestiana]KTD01952.1 proton/peptide symporter family protein [Legionella geestiana]QBS12889.1 MFS transporter [Legionella geestiana]QDQ39420.1 peptide MFS transporter [Legionella geestiana]STX54620.1 putative Alkaline phosphatase [Legionella geestiana]
MIKTLQRMPKGITALYFIQAFSTFSYAILYSSLSLFITKQLGLSNTVSNSIVGLFLAFNYILHLLGGVMGGRYLSNRTLFSVTTIMQSIGIVCLAYARSTLLYWGLSCFLVGCGLSTTCFNSMVTQRFQPGDNRRESAFFVTYTTMNIGFFAGYISSGFFDQSNQYQLLFYACAAINLITVILMAMNWNHLADHDTPLATQKPGQQKRVQYLKGIAMTLLLIPLMILCFHSANISNGLIVVMSLVMFGVILIIGQKQKIMADKQKIRAFLILAITSIVFWMIYFTGPMGITLFVKNNVDKQLFGYELATQWLFNINALVIIIGAPVMSMIINRLRLKGYNFAVSTQFAWGFVILALSFFLLSYGVTMADDQGSSSIVWVILHFVTQAMAELLIGPVGYAMIGRIAPAKLQGVLMGTWMMVSGVAASISQYFSNAMMKAQATDPLLTNADYLHVFNQLGVWALTGGVFLYFISGKIRNLIDDTNTSACAAVNSTAA